jgi:hypothetical protein
MAHRRRDQTGPLIFEAALVPSGRKALTLDADGEAILTLAIPATDALSVVSRFMELMDRSFVVSISLENEHGAR